MNAPRTPCTTQSAPPAAATDARTLVAPAVGTVSLDAPEARHWWVTGREGASLASMRAAGLPVAPGFVVPVDAFPSRPAQVPDALAGALAAARSALGSGPLTVRTSSVAEAAERGATEQRHTVDRGGAAALCRAVEDCWRGVHRAGAHAGAPPPAAVVVQRRPAAEASGFAAAGMDAGRGSVLDEAVAALARRVVAAGGPRRIEWALTDGTLLVLGSAPEPPVPHIALADGWVDLERREVHRGSVPTRLTPSEHRLLSWLAERPGRLVDTARLLIEVWGYRRGVQSRTAYVTIQRLRRKIEVDPASPRHLETVFGAGYRFVPAG